MQTPTKLSVGISYWNILYWCSFLLSSLFIAALVILEFDRSYKQKSICFLESGLHHLNEIEIYTHQPSFAQNAINKTHQLYYECLESALEHIEKAYLLSAVRDDLHELKSMIAEHVIEQVSSSAVSVDKNLRHTKQSTSYIVERLRHEQDETGSQILFLLSACGVIFVVTYVSIPVCKYVEVTKPQRRQAQLLEAALNGNLTDDAHVNLKPKSLFEQTVYKTVNTIRSTEQFIDHLGKGNFETEWSFGASDHFQKSLLNMQEKLKEVTRKERTNAVINENINALEKLIKVESDADKLYERIIALLSKGTGSSVGILYGLNDENTSDSFLFQLSTYGVIANSKTVKIGEGQLGQAVHDKKTTVLSNVPNSYVKIESGLGASSAHYILIVPLLFKNDVYGALELASFKIFEPHHVQLIEKAAESIAAHLFNHKVHEQSKKRLEELTDKQAKELVEIHRLQEETYRTLELKLTEVEDEKHKNEAILEGCVDAVISFDASGKIYFCNKACEDVLGYSKAVLKQEGILGIIPLKIQQGDEPRCFYINEMGEKEIGVRTEASITSAAGEVIDVLITSTTVDVHNEVLFTFFIQKISVDLF